nr:MAG TPA: hypothetical protein [Bacteriophage sp.]
MKSLASNFIESPNCKTSLGLFSKNSLRSYSSSFSARFC